MNIEAGLENNLDIFLISNTKEQRRATFIKTMLFDQTHLKREFKHISAHTYDRGQKTFLDSLLLHCIAV